MATLSAGRLRCEYLTDPIGIDVRAPRLSWTLTSDRRGARQAGYRILVASMPDLLEEGRGDLWDSGRVEQSRHEQIAYAGTALGSRQRAWWKVEVSDELGASEWSAPASFEMGLLDRDDWRARWIGMEPVEFGRDDYRPAPHLRTEFTVRAGVRRARLYATALGLYRAFVNGVRAGDDAFTPGWTDYTRRLQYQTYDVTDAIRSGANAVGVILGDGWYCGHLAISFQRQTYGPYPEGLVQLEIEYEDGSRDVVGTDGSWRASYGPILASDLLLGEAYDARMELGRWTEPGYDDSAWAPALQTRGTESQPVAQRSEPVRVTEEVPSVAVTAPVFQTHVFDLGQNIVGWSRLKVRGAPAGTEITIRHGEAINADGTLYTANLRLARQTERYICKGGDEEVFEPHFTFHGFRYVEVVGYPGVPSEDAVTGIVAHSAMTPAGMFACSNEMVNKLHSNIRWCQRGNFLEVPTDCPQRNERLGWLGDARIFSRTATFNYDTAAFFTKWLWDIHDTRTSDGIYPDFAPWTGSLGDGGPGWSDAGVFIPWLMFERFGDTRVIEEHYDEMTRFIDTLHKENPDLIRTNRGGMNWGDWLSMPDDPEVGRHHVLSTVYSTTPKEVFATAFFARSTELLARMAAVIGREDDARRYTELAADIRARFNTAFVADDGRITGDTQTAYALAICFELLPEAKIEAAGRHLVAAIERRDWHLATGIAGTELLLPALERVGRTDVAYRLLLTDTFPSWGYTIRNGATTIWERWDGWTEERGFQDIHMNSFNHYALGSVGAWIYSAIGGIGFDPAEPGGSRIVIRPRPGEGITHADASYESMHGTVSCSWSTADGGFRLSVAIPPGARAQVHLPTPAADRVTESGVPLASAQGIEGVRVTGGEVRCEIGSGHYAFEVPA